jgi:hypothetical protein
MPVPVAAGNKWAGSGAVLSTLIPDRGQRLISAQQLAHQMVTQRQAWLCYSLPAPKGSVAEPFSVGEYRLASRGVRHP